MLSILIPVYNYDITRLVHDLYQQAVDAFIDFEILVMEDGSTQFLDENKLVENLPFCHYTVLTKNIGRSAIRNRLADEAKYEHLLFLDCDAEIPNTNFINKYLSFCNEDTVVIGGRIYKEDKTPEYSLLRKYGTKREQNTIKNKEQRKKFPMFTTPNFLITKKIFEQVRFDENIKGYGHEDTIFGVQLQRQGIAYSFIDNPIIHIGIETNDVFLSKTEHAIHNLYKLYLSNNYKELELQSKLLQTFIFAKKYRLLHLLSFAYTILKNILKQNLIGSNPSLRLFDIYKLLYLCHTAAQK